MRSAEGKQQGGGGGPMITSIRVSERRAFFESLSSDSSGEEGNGSSRRGRGPQGRIQQRQRSISSSPAPLKPGSRRGFSPLATTSSTTVAHSSSSASFPSISSSSVTATTTTISTNTRFTLSTTTTTVACSLPGSSAVQGRDRSKSWEEPKIPLTFLDATSTPADEETNAQRSNYVHDSHPTTKAGSTTNSSASSTGSATDLAPPSRFPGTASPSAASISLHKQTAHTHKSLPNTPRTSSEQAHSLARTPDQSQLQGIVSDATTKRPQGCSDEQNAVVEEEEEEVILKNSNVIKSVKATTSVETKPLVAQTDSTTPAITKEDDDANSRQEARSPVQEARTGQDKERIVNTSDEKKKKHKNKQERTPRSQNIFGEHNNGETTEKSQSYRAKRREEKKSRNSALMPDHNMTNAQLIRHPMPWPLTEVERKEREKEIEERRELLRRRKNVPLPPLNLDLPYASAAGGVGSPTGGPRSPPRALLASAPSTRLPRAASDAAAASPLISPRQRPAVSGVPLPRLSFHLASPASLPSSASTSSLGQSLPSVALPTKRPSFLLEEEPNALSLKPILPSSTSSPMIVNERKTTTVTTAGGDLANNNRDSRTRRARRNSGEGHAELNGAQQWLLLQPEGEEDEPQHETTSNVYRRRHCRSMSLATTYASGLEEWRLKNSLTRIEELEGNRKEKAKPDKDEGRENEVEKDNAKDKRRKQSLRSPKKGASTLRRVIFPPSTSNPVIATEEEQLRNPSSAVLQLQLQQQGLEAERVLTLSDQYLQKRQARAKHSRRSKERTTSTECTLPVNNEHENEKLIMPAEEKNTAYTSDEDEEDVVDTAPSFVPHQSKPTTPIDKQKNRRASFASMENAHLVRHTLATLPVLSHHQQTPAKCQPDQNRGTQEQVQRDREGNEASPPGNREGEEASNEVEALLPREKRASKTLRDHQLAVSKRGSISPRSKEQPRVDKQIAMEEAMQVKEAAETSVRKEATKNEEDEELLQVEGDDYYEDEGIETEVVSVRKKSPRDMYYGGKERPSNAKIQETEKAKKTLISALRKNFEGRKRTGSNLASYITRRDRKDKTNSKEGQENAAVVDTAAENMEEPFEKEKYKENVASFWSAAGLKKVSMSLTQFPEIRSRLKHLRGGATGKEAKEENREYEENTAQRGNNVQEEYGPSREINAFGENNSEIGSGATTSSHLPSISEEMDTPIELRSGEYSSPSDSSEGSSSFPPSLSSSTSSLDGVLSLDATSLPPLSFDHPLFYLEEDSDDDGSGSTPSSPTALTLGWEERLSSGEVRLRSHSEEDALWRIRGSSGNRRNRRPPRIGSSPVGLSSAADSSGEWSESWSPSKWRRKRHQCMRRCNSMVEAKSPSWFLLGMSLTATGNPNGCEAEVQEEEIEDDVGEDEDSQRSKGKEKVTATSDFMEEGEGEEEDDGTEKRKDGDESGVLSSNRSSTSFEYGMYYVGIASHMKRLRRTMSMEDVQEMKRKKARMVIIPFRVSIPRGHRSFSTDTMHNRKPIIEDEHWLRRQKQKKKKRTRDELRKKSLERRFLKRTGQYNRLSCIEIFLQLLNDNEFLVSVLLKKELSFVKEICNIGDDAEKATLCTALVHIFEAHHSATSLIYWSIREEVLSTMGCNTDVSSTLFREDCLASKFLNAYAIQEGKDYLCRTLRPVIKKCFNSHVSYEVNPYRLDTQRGNNTSKQNFRRLYKLTQSLLLAILDARSSFPPTIQRVYAYLTQEIDKRFTAEKRMSTGQLTKTLSTSLLSTAAGDNSSSESESDGATKARHQLQRRSEELSADAQLFSNDPLAVVEDQPAPPCDSPSTTHHRGGFIRQHVGPNSTLSSSASAAFHMIASPFVIATSNASSLLSPKISRRTRESNITSSSNHNSNETSPTQSPQKSHLSHNSSSPRNQTSSPPLFSPTLRKQRHTEESIGLVYVGGFVFLRFFCPAIVTPELYEIVDKSPTREARRGLTLAAKVLQTMANQIEFGEKEAYMKPMNDFIAEYQPRMNDYLYSLVHQTKIKNKKHSKRLSLPRPLDFIPSSASTLPARPKPTSTINLLSQSSPSSSSEPHNSNNGILSKLLPHQSVPSSLTTDTELQKEALQVVKNHCIKHRKELDYTLFKKMFQSKE
ncbi:Ras GTPase activating protein ira2 [Balamuthia mandrillaris]